MKDSPIVSFFVERFVFALAAFGALAVFGFLAVPGLGVDLLPKFEVPVVAISTAYPGAGPEDIANQVSKPIEDALTTLDGIDSITSTSSEGVSVVVVQFNFGQDTARAATDVAQRVAGVRGSLPRDAQAPVVSKFDPSASAIMNIAISAPGVSLADLSDYAENVMKPNMQRVDGVADVEISGAPKRQIQVLLNPNKLQQYNLSPNQVSNAIGATSLAQSAGSRTQDGLRILYSLRTSVKAIQDVESLMIDTNRGLRLSDVATVRETSADTTSFSRVNGVPVVSLGIRKTPDGNSVKIAENVRKRLAEIKVPKGYKAQIVSDTTTYIKASVDDTWKETLITIVVVSLVVMVFLGKLNTVFSVVLAIPISLAGALIVFSLLGFTFNIISLLAIVVAVGIVVDDSIVVAENIERYRAMGYGLKDSVLKGSSEVVSAVSAASLSLLAVFLPISFLPGIVGQFFREFGLGLAAAVFFSWLEALFFLTVRMAYTPDPEPLRLSQAFSALRDVRPFIDSFTKHWRSPLGIVGALAYAGVLAYLNLWALFALPLYPLVLGIILYLTLFLYRLVNAIAFTVHSLWEVLFHVLQNGYTNALRAALRAPWVILLLGVLLFLSVGIVGTKIPFNFTPKQDSGIAVLTLELPKGTSVDATDALIRPIEAFLLKRPEVDVIETEVGGGNPERGQITVNMKPRHDRPPLDDILAVYRESLKDFLKNRPEVSLRVGVPQGGPPSNADYEISLDAPTPELLRERTEKVLEVLRARPDLIEARSTLSQTSTEQVFVPDPARLSGTGITPLDIANTLRAYNAGSEATVLRRSGKEIPIIVKADPRFVQNESDLLSLPVYSQALGSSVPLGNLGRFRSQQVPASLARSNQAFSASIQANFPPGVNGLFKIQSEVKAELIKRKILDDQVTLGDSGRSAFVGDLATAAPAAFGLALLLNYLVIASQFNSFRYPIYILIPVPLALVGAFWMAYWVGTGLDIISVLGTVLLIGLVTKNAILLLDFVVREAQGTTDLREALIEAGRLRLRPILMTTATVLIISFPLILGTGEGAELRKPLGVIVLGGLLSSTLLTLFVVPSAFYMFERRRYQAKQEEEAAAQLVMAGTGGISLTKES